MKLTSEEIWCSLDAARTNCVKTPLFSGLPLTSLTAVLPKMAIIVESSFVFLLNQMLENWAL